MEISKSELNEYENFYKDYKRMIHIKDINQKKVFFRSLFDQYSFNS